MRNPDILKTTKGMPKGPVNYHSGHAKDPHGTRKGSTGAARRMDVHSVCDRTDEDSCAAALIAPAEGPRTFDLGVHLDFLSQPFTIAIG
jgi:hypothetical protein